MTAEPTAPQPGLAYLLLKNSLKLFEKPWPQLTATEQEVARREAMEELRLQQLILRTAEAAGVILDPAVLDQAIGLIRKRFADPQGFTDELRAHQLDEETLRHAVANELRVDGVLALIGQQGGQANAEEVAAFYHANQEHFHTPELRTARHILITINDDFPDNTRNRARQRIEAAHDQLQEDPARFGELVQRYSECPSALRNGELGTVPEGQLFPALNQVLFAMHQGEVSDIVESHLGFHIILCEAIKPAGVLTCEEAAPRIQALLNQKRQQRAQRDWLAGIIQRQQ